MIKKTTFIFLFLLVTVHNTAQEIKFGSVSKEELTEKEFVNDKSASAAILYKHRNSYLVTTNGNTQLITEIFERVKIYDKDGFEYATKEISLYKNRSQFLTP